MQLKSALFYKIRLLTRAKIQLPLLNPYYSLFPGDPALSA